MGSSQKIKVIGNFRGQKKCVVFVVKVKREVQRFIESEVAGNKPIAMQGPHLDPESNKFKFFQKQNL